MDKYIKLTSDIVFQRLFGKIGNENITKAFLEKVLGIEIETLTLDTNKRLIGDIVDNKIGRIDVKAVLNDGTKVIIEMQVARYKYIAKRVLYYWAQTYTGDLRRGQEYEELDKTIAILITVEDIEEARGIEKYHTQWELREIENLDKKFSNDIEIHVIELSKFKEGQEARPEDDWIRAIMSKGGEEMKEISKHSEELQKMREELERITADPEMREIYYQREKDLRDALSWARAEREEGYEDGRSKGKEEGIEETKKEIVLNMHKAKVKIEDICKYTNLTKKEVEEIIKSE